MKVIITSKNLHASDHLKDTIEKKFEKLGKYFSNDIAVNVMLSSEKNREKVEATINAKGTIFRAEEVNNDVYNAIDRVVDKLSSQMSRFKTKLQRKHTGQKEFFFEEMPDAELEEDSRVVKTKRFSLRPMSVEEAIMQMELVAHEFFVFLNADSGTVNVVYKRNDGNYGILETEY